MLISTLLKPLICPPVGLILLIFRCKHQIMMLYCKVGVGTLKLTELLQRAGSKNRAQHGRQMAISWTTTRGLQDIYEIISMWTRLVFSHVGSGRGSEVSSGVVGYIYRFRRVRDRYCFRLHWELNWLLGLVCTMWGLLTRCIIIPVHSIWTMYYKWLGKCKWLNISTRTFHCLLHIAGLCLWETCGYIKDLSDLWACSEKWKAWMRASNYKTLWAVKLLLLYNCNDQNKTFCNNNQKFSF